MTDDIVTKQRSRAWYLVPLFFGIIGSIVAWLAVKEDDPPLGRGVWYVGIALTVVYFAFIAIGTVMGF